MRKPPRAEPIRPPALHAAWKEDMMARPHRVSTTLAWAFIGTSTTMFTKPNRNAHAARKPTPGDRRWVWGRVASRSAISGQEIRRVRPVPLIFDGSTPATGMADRPPTAAANSTIERRASVRPKSVLISGIATAHAPMQRPLAKKIAVTPPRARTRPFARAGSIVEERLTRRSLKHYAPGQPLTAFDPCKAYRGARERRRAFWSRSTALSAPAATTVSPPVGTWRNRHVRPGRPLGHGVGGAYSPARNGPSGPDSSLATSPSRSPRCWLPQRPRYLSQAGSLKLGGAQPALEKSRSRSTSRSRPSPGAGRTGTRCPCNSRACPAGGRRHLLLRKPRDRRWRDAQALGGQRTRCFRRPA